METARNTTLVDYFAVAGYDSEVGLVESTFDGVDEATSSKTRPPLARSFVPKIIQHFPDRRKEYPFPDEILPLCMPRGLRFYTEKDVPQYPTVHTFANIREDGSRINGTCITFYEEVRDPLVCEAMARLQQEHVITTVSRRDSGKLSTDRERSHFPPGTVSGGTHTLPRGRRDRTKRISYYEGGGQSSLFMTKSICLVTRLPLVSSSSVLLTFLHSILTSSAPPPLPLESYIYWCLYEVPMPLPGTTLKVPLMDSTIVLQRPGPSELPFFDDCIGNIFEYLSVEKFIRLFSCFLLEYQILICSKNFDRLMAICETLLALAFPFKWQMVYVPILPYSQLKFVEAPVPYVMGFCYEDEIPEHLFQSNVCVVDVDKDKAELLEDLPMFPAAKQLGLDINNAIKRYSNLENVVCEVTERRRSDASNGGEQVKYRQNKPTARRTADWLNKRMSKSFDFEEYGGLNGDTDYTRSNKDGLSQLPIEDVLRDNTTFAQISEIAQRVGVNVDMKNLAAKLGASQNLDSTVAKKYFNNAKLNNAIRECVLNKFIGMFFSYEHFVIGGQGCPDRETYEASRDSMVSFDKASFLSDQPDSHLAFLSAFLETQMFTSFIDSKILSQWETPDEALVLFDARICAMREKEKMGVSMVRTPTTEHTAPFADSEQLIVKREGQSDYVVPEPHPLAGAIPVNYNGAWPVYQLNTMLLDGASMMSPAPSPWKQRYSHVRQRKAESIVNGNVRPTSTYGGAALIVDASLIAKQQYVFVEKLLAETKAKTKRMLVDKMGKEALQLGHLDAGITGVEENTLVASFCDLLERIWAHGLKNKQGKSALWSFVLQHQDFEKPGLTTRAASTSLLTPGAEVRGSRQPYRQRPIDEVPAPVIINNDTAVLSTLSNLVDSIRTGGGGEEPWSKSLLRAATFIADRFGDVNGNPTEQQQPMQQPQRRPPPLPLHMRPRSMRKSSSFTTGEFASPSWMPPPLQPEPQMSGAMSCESSPRKVRSTSTSRTSRARSPEGARVVLSPLPVHIAYDLKNVLRMTEIKTDIGYARAFVRLALERKLLHKHLTTLLNNDRLMSELYKEYSFVRFDEEKEQFLYHILSLNAAQFRCFTNTFTKTKMDYQVVIVSGAWRGTLPAIWVTVEGTLCSTPAIMLKANTPLFKFDHKNLGILSTLRIGHQETEKPQKWFLEYVLVRNEITGQTYRFPCGRWFGEDRWFGRSGEEGTLERLLIAEPFNEVEEACTAAAAAAAADPASPARSRRMNSRSQTPQRDRSPSAGRIQEQIGSSSNKKIRIREVEHVLGEAVNALVRYYHSEKKIKSELANLLCGQRGLVMAIEAAFQVGRQESLWTIRMFRSSYPWDYVEKVSMWFFDLKRMKGDERFPREQRELIDYCLILHSKISAKQSLGKDVKFHVFVLLSIKNQMMSSLLNLMAWTPVTAEFYNEPSFLRTAQHLNYLSQLLKALNEFTIEFDPTLTYGVV